MSGVLKKILLILYLFCFVQFVHAQYSDAEVFKQMNPSAQKNASVDSLKKIISSAREDADEVMILLSISNIYRWSFPDSALSYSLQGLHLSEKLNFDRGMLKSYHSIGQALAIQGNYSKALEIELKALKLSENLNDQLQISLSFFWIAVVYLESGDNQKALYYFYKLKSNTEVFLKNQELIFFHIGFCYSDLNKLDSALFYFKKSYDLEVNEKNNWCGPYLAMAGINEKLNRSSESLNYYRMGINIAFAKKDIIDSYNGMAYVFKKNNLFDSSIYYAKKALLKAQEEPFLPEIIAASKLLAEVYKINNFKDSALKYEELMLEAKDSLFSVEKIKQLQNLSFNEQLREKGHAEANAKEAARHRMIIIISSILVAIASSLIWYRIRQLRLKYKTILEQKEAEKLKVKYEKQLLELEANALRAQMNPHFIFNCMNSMKALIQKHENENAVTYLTTFSKLIRTIFQNSDKGEITLFEEIETCQLYTKFENMRFEGQFKYHFNIEEAIDLKSIMVPTLILQPFIENAIWHGIMPKADGGNVSVSVMKKDESILCIIEDNGIGRNVSNQNKFKGESATHQSKGVSLTQSRLKLNNLLNKGKANLEIVDKKDSKGKSAGTKIIIQLTEY